METIRLEEMNWVDIRQAINAGFTRVIFGVGSTEQHGPHLPIKTDAFVGDLFAEGIARALGRTLIAPSIRVGCSDQHLKFAGTISLRGSTLRALLEDYISSLSQHGFDTIIIIPSHGGNFATVKEVIDDNQQRSDGVRVVGFTDLMGIFDLLNNLSGNFGISKEASGVHAGENETSIMMSLQRHLVKPDRFQPGYLGPFGKDEFQKLLEHGVGILSERGVLGDPTLADADHGRVYLSALIEYLTDAVSRGHTER